MKRFKKILTIRFLALVAGIVLLILFLRLVDFNQIWAFLQKMGWKFIWVIVITSIGYWLSTYAWYLTFRKSDLKVSLPNLFVYRQMGETLSLINPASVLAGDTAKALLLRKHGVSLEEGVSSVIISRALIGLSLIILLILSSVFYVDTLGKISGPLVQAVFFLLVLMIASGVLFLFISPKMYLYKNLKFFQKNGLHFISDSRLKQIRLINFSLADYFVNHRGKLVLAFALSGLHWLMGAAEFYVILYLLGVPVTVTAVIMLEMGVMMIKGMGSFVPAQIGVEEYGNKLMLKVVGISMGGIWLAVSVIRRARQIFWLGMGSCFFLWRYKSL